MQIRRVAHRSTGSALAALVLLAAGCGGGDDPPSAATTSSTAPAAAEIEVMGVTIVAAGGDAEAVERVETQVRSVLDRGDDGRPDADEVVEALAAAGATIEVGGAGGALEARYDASGATLHLAGVEGAGRLELLEPIHELLYRHGWSEAFDLEFGLRQGSELAFGMDRARGGRFPQPPATYPTGAWYTNTDPDCDYECQLVTYFFHIHMTFLGEYEGADVCRDVSTEWQPCTVRALAARDGVAHEVFGNPEAALVDRGS